MEGYMTIKEISKKWGFSTRWVNELCKAGKIPGAQLFAGVWAIPSQAEKPTSDKRVKTGVYKDWRKKYGKNKVIASL